MAVMPMEVPGMATTDYPNAGQIPTARAFRERDGCLVMWIEVCRPREFGERTKKMWSLARQCWLR